MSGICFIFGAGDANKVTKFPGDKDFCIAADGGYDMACSLGIKPDLLIGDMDSTKHTNLPKNSLKYPREKDDTDMMLAIKEGLSRGYSNFIIHGGLGGRLDHTLANIQALHFLADRHCQGTLFSDNYALTVIKDDTVTLPARDQGYVSIFSLSDTSEGVTLEGSKYVLTNGTLCNSFPLGVSNEFVGTDIQISVKKGTLCVMWYLS